MDQKEKSQLTDLVAEHVQSASKTLVALGAEFFYVLNKVIRWDDKVYSAQVLVLSFVVSCVCDNLVFVCTPLSLSPPNPHQQFLNHFHLTTLLFLAWIGAFSVPAFLEKNQDAPWMKQAKGAVEEKVKKVLHRAPTLCPPPSRTGSPAGGCAGIQPEEDGVERLASIQFATRCKCFASQSVRARAHARAHVSRISTTPNPPRFHCFFTLGTQLWRRPLAWSNISQCLCTLQRCR